MDTLVAQYTPDSDDFYDSDEQLSFAKPTHDHQFSLPPISQVSPLTDIAISYLFHHRNCFGS